MSHHLGSSLKLDSKSGVGQSLCDGAFDFEGVFFFSQNLTSAEKLLAPNAQQIGVDSNKTQA